MKKKLLSLACILATGLVSAQQVSDSLSVGAGYTDMAWYSLENGETGRATQADWDLAFEVTGFGSAIWINAAAGASIWECPGDTSDFATLDTTGYAGWTQHHNADTSWAWGAFNQGAAGLDLGWGTYSTVTHIVTGDQLYLVQLGNGSYQKLWIQSLNGGTYTFRHATLDNSMDMTHQLDKSNYSDKNFGYFSLQNHGSIDPEPANTNWDFLFTRYTAYLPTPYLVSGLLSNQGVTVAQANQVNDPWSYSDFSAHNFESEINTIGFDWKSYQGFWAIEDSLVYFVETSAGDIWKLIMTDFGGSGNGYYHFSKEKLSGVGISPEATPLVLNMYPNPTTNTLNITLNSDEALVIDVFNMTGQLVMQEAVNANGLAVTTLNVAALPAGTYYVCIQNDTHRTTLPFIKR
jgi:hypothetical protein